MIKLPENSEKEKRAKEALAKYAESKELQLANIIHLYPHSFWSNSNIPDTLLFDLHIFNTGIKEKREIKGYFDDVILTEAFVKRVQIYADGSTLVELKGMHKVIDSISIVDILPLERR